MPKLKRSKILLIFPNIRPFQFIAERLPAEMGHIFPLSLSYLASFVGEYGYEAKILDAYSGNFSQKDINTVIKEFAPDVVGVTSPINHEFGIGTIKVCKSMDPKIVTVLGGLTPTFMPREIMEYVPELDYIISGEGEIPFLYLLRALEGEMSFDDIKGLVHRKDGGAIVVNDGRYRVEDLDSLPFPAKDRFLTKKGIPYFKCNRGVAIIASRGCYYGCKFCAVNKQFGSGVRYRSPQRVVEELRECVEKYKINMFYFWDSTFTADPEYTHRLMDEIIKSDIHRKFRFRCATRLGCVDLGLLKKLKAANCFCISYGVESCSQEVLDSYDKKWPLEKTIDIFNETKKAGINTRAMFIFNQYAISGDAAIKRQADDLIAFLKKLKPSIWALFPLTICPNSPMYEEILGEGGIDADGYKELFKGNIIPSKRMSSNELGRFIFEISQKSRMNFMKYAFHGSYSRHA